MTIKPGMLKALCKKHFFLFSSVKFILQLFKKSDIEANIAERSASEMLEAAVATTPSFLSSKFLCVFTVASNIFTGLEFTEHTCYDIILINHDLTRNIDAVKFARILRKVEVQTPIIFVNEDSSSDLLEEEGGSLFSCLLQKPFSSSVLCEAMFFSLKNITPVPARAHSRKEKRADVSQRKVTKINKKDINNTIDCSCGSLATGESEIKSPSPIFPLLDPFLDTNIDRLLQQGDFDLVYLSNCDFLPQTM